MHVYIVDCPYGIFIINEKGEIIEKFVFNSPLKAAKTLTEINEGKLPPEIINSIKKFSKEKIILDNEALAKALTHELNVEFQKPCLIIDKFKQDLTSTILKLKILRNKEEIEDFSREVAVLIAKEKLKAASAKKDLYAIQISRALEDIDKTLNLFSGRIREWYSLIFPELNNLVDSHEAYIKLIIEFGNKSAFTINNLLKAGWPIEKAEQISRAAVNSIGVEIQDINVLKNFCSYTLSLFNLRRQMEKYLSKLMNEVAPNLTELIGSTLSAKLISLAGGLENLAKMPASTIQVLGAEKALFRALKTGSKPPKHGVIFQHVILHQSPKWQRGKIARALAGKIAIAARLDAFKGEFKAEELKKELEERIKEIKEKYKKPMRKNHAKRKS
ncbi:MAG: C/D box methylation guide ribonucleoprotein complex aNOP56 subunit [Candidatus Bathyarchaeia archaeon]|nr:C/D box methylation guide ribonucleoprotein complex aNOP56 subunit [Candidatus Bathyarchaeota archaeon]